MAEIDRNAAFGSSGQDDFQHLTDPHRHELLVHCYRLLGSLEDAEDAVQETLLRAWRHLDSLETRASLRAWLYKIATNSALDMLDRRKPRSLPGYTHPPADPEDPLLTAITDPVWIDPLPDAYLESCIISPEARYELHESVSLAFLVVLQKLPARQRAILILRDVLGWKAEEAAKLLGITIVAVNSALQRARATMKNAQPVTHSAPVQADTARTAALLTRYVAAWETADIASLVALLREDAAWTMPPVPTWYRGRAAIKTFLDKFLFAGQAQGRFRLVATQANSAPAFAVYQRDGGGVYRPGGLQILSIVDDQIVQIDDFLVQDDRLFSRFNLPFFM